ncbi:hypothetical protein PF002_g24524 [Phytophthora fragariae]|uniref:Uncharacterized protein n=1 Tax=Phytophthora fragariae TaxID=53985 RepID=A0A6A3WV90_9STRA|nr:hypothetical protein PF002_g24524 [Phytophthora fragariae]
MAKMKSTTGTGGKQRAVKGSNEEERNYPRRSSVRSK